MSGLGRFSIRTRLALIYTALLLAALAAFGAGTFLVLRAQLESSFDTSLVANAEHAAGAFAQDVGSDGRLQPTPRLLDQFAATGGRVAILDETGKLVLDSAPPGTAPLSLPDGKLPAPNVEHVVGASATNGSSLRVLVHPIMVGGRTVGYVVWAASTADIDTLLRTVALVLVGGTLLLTAVAFVVGRRLAGRALAPVAEVTDTARAISLSGDFGARVETTASPGDEVGELAVAFNEMLAALEENHKALQRFLGDASHQLRTPLTTLRAGLELIDRPGLPEAERAELLADARSETERMTRLVGDLLSLARAESGARLAAAPVDLDEVLLEAVRQSATSAPAGVRVDVGALEPAVVQVDRDRIKELFLILLDNATRYTPEGGSVSASLRVGEGRVEVVVEDSGIGIPEPERERVFERLYRGAEARRLRPSGTGLGLAIARWIVEAQGGSIRAAARDTGSGTRMVVELPGGRP